MRVALLSYNAQRHNAVGNHIAEKVRFFQERGAEVRLFVQNAQHLHPDVRWCTLEIAAQDTAGQIRGYLQHADLVFAIYAQYHDLLQYLPCLAGSGPRIVFDYLGVTPPAVWRDQQREGLDVSVRERGYAWCADHALTISAANRQELLHATRFPEACTTTLPLAVDTTRFRPEPRAHFLQNKLGAVGPLLLYVGRLAVNKRVTLLIEALTHLPDAHAVIVGDCTDVYAAEAARCRERAQQLGVMQRVHFLGQLSDDELAQAYRSADVLVIPSVHEGFCVPVIEAQASGLPVVASRSAALPETVGAAGLTFVPEDVNDLVQQLRRVLHDAPAPKPRPGPRRIAIVSFRFGPDIVGGAETSLRTVACILQDAGHHVEVFTTCTRSESHWQNELSAGTAQLAGLTVHRFFLDAHDPVAHAEAVRAILEAGGRVTPELEARYLQHSIHSTPLLDALRRRRAELDGIIVGPYLFGLTADVVREFHRQVLLVPCFHDEPLACLTIWPRLYSGVGGVLYHSAEEQHHAQARLGVNHPNAHVIGTCLELDAAVTAVSAPRPYVVYCGRYSAQKNVPLLLEWARRYQAENPGRLEFVFVGQGEVKLPQEPWLRDLGFVDEATKRGVLAGAKALVQLSTQESLSLVALEAWAQQTPIIVHRDCTVLAGQVERSQGGVTIADYGSFARSLDELTQDERKGRQRGVNGRAYVDRHYGSRAQFVGTIRAALKQMRSPIGQQMRAQGPVRAAEFARPRWQQRFAEFVENLLTQPARSRRDDVVVEPLRPTCSAATGPGTLLAPVRIRNAGTHAVLAAGPGRSVICCEIHTADDVVRSDLILPALLMPGEDRILAVPLNIPAEAGAYRVTLRAEGQGAPGAEAEMTLQVAAGTSRDRAGAAVFLDAVQKTLPRAHQLAQLPSDYVDVTEGRLAPVKRLIKRKLLNNFKHAYLDVLSRQQSQVNGQVVLMIQQLSECCALLDHAVAGLHQRLDGLEAKIDRLALPQDPQKQELHE